MDIPVETKATGFSLVEVLISMAMMAGMAFFLVRFLMAGVYLNHMSSDETQMNTLVNDRLEQLKTMSFSNIGMPCLNSSPTCGSLTSNYTDTSVTPNILYYDTGNPNYLVRWTISLPTGDMNTRKLTVLVISQRYTAMGNPRQVTAYFERTKY